MIKCIHLVINVDSVNYDEINPTDLLASHICLEWHDNDRWNCTASWGPKQTHHVVSSLKAQLYKTFKNCRAKQWFFSCATFEPLRSGSRGIIVDLLFTYFRGMTWWFIFHHPAQLSMKNEQWPNYTYDDITPRTPFNLDRPGITTSWQ